MYDKCKIGVTVLEIDMSKVQSLVTDIFLVNKIKNIFCILQICYFGC